MFHLMLLKIALDCLCTSTCFSLFCRCDTVLTFQKSIGFVSTNKKVEKTCLTKPALSVSGIQLGCLVSQLLLTLWKQAIFKMVEQFIHPYIKPELRS